MHCDDNPCIDGTLAPQLPKGAIAKAVSYAILSGDWFVEGCHVMKHEESESLDARYLWIHSCMGLVSGTICR